MINPPIFPESDMSDSPESQDQSAWVGPPPTDLEKRTYPTCPNRRKYHDILVKTDKPQMSDLGEWEIMI